MSQIHIGSMASVVDGQNVLWMSNAFFNGLFRMDLNSRELCCVGAFEGADLSAEELHKGAHISGKEIIFTPFYDEAVRIYHTDSNAFQTIAIPAEHKPPFGESVRAGQNIFFLSEDGCIWNYDIEKHSVGIDEMSKDYKRFLDVAGDVAESTYSDGFLLLKRHSSLLCRIDLVRRETEVIHIEGAPDNLQVALYGQGLYWFFLSDSQDVVSWNRERSEFTFYKCEKEHWAKDHWKDSATYLPYAKSGALFTEDMVWISNYHAMSPIWIGRDKKNVEAVFENLEGFHVRESNIWGPIYPNCHIVGEDICFIPCYANMLICCNRMTGMVRTAELALPQEQIPYFDGIVKDKWKSKVLREREEIYTIGELIRKIKGDTFNPF